MENNRWKYNNNLFYTRNYIILNETTLNYGDYKIIISQESYIQVQKHFYNIPFLYYDKQIINIDNNDSYELKFKFESYNNDILYICGQSNNYAILDNCKIGTNELNCNISKNKLEEILTFSGEQFIIGTMNDYVGLFPFDFVFHII